MCCRRHSTRVDSVKTSSSNGDAAAASCCCHATGGSAALRGTRRVRPVTRRQPTGRRTPGGKRRASAIGKRVRGPMQRQRDFRSRNSVRQRRRSVAVTHALPRPPPPPPTKRMTFVLTVAMIDGVSTLYETKLKISFTHYTAACISYVYHQPPYTCEMFNKPGAFTPRPRMTSAMR
jgi:hypothetical protein